MVNYIPFVTYVLITTFTPGPNNIMSMLNAGKVGIKRGIKFNIGIFIGFTIVMILCGIFGEFLARHIPAIKPVMKYIGALYILWLAYKTYKSKYHILDKNEIRSYGIKEGLSLQFINPKVILYGMTTLSTFVLPYYNNQLHILIFAVVLAGIAFFATVCWAIFGTIFHRLLKNSAKQVNTIMSLVLVYTAISLLLP